jgi:hypothetical protein
VRPAFAVRPGVCCAVQGHYCIIQKLVTSKLAAAEIFGFTLVALEILTSLSHTFPYPILPVIRSKAQNYAFQSFEFTRSPRMSTKSVVTSNYSKHVCVPACGRLEADNSTQASAKNTSVFSRSTWCKDGPVCRLSHAAGEWEPRPVFFTSSL